MPNVIYTATLDFTDNGVFNAGWRIKQGDFGSSSLNITLSDNGAIVFDDSIEPEIVFKRADGRSVISTMQSAGENSGYYIYNFVGNELAVPGPCVVDVKIVGSDSRTSTASCRFDVIDDTIGYDPTGAGTYNNPVSALAETALSTAQQAESWAVGTKNGLPVSSGDPTYHNNSKYWSELRMGSKIKNTAGQFYTTTGGMLDSCVIGFEPIQSGSGTPSPSNVRAISGHTQAQVRCRGKNKFTPTGKTANYFLNSSGTPVSSNGWNYSDYLPISGETITMSTQGEGVGNSPSICFYDLNKTFISGEVYANALIKTFTVPPNAVYCRASYYNLWESTYQIEEGSQATEYTPYNGYTHIINLGGTYYGGTLDAVSGVLTVTHGIKDLGTLTYTAQTNISSFYATLSDAPNGATDTTMNAICSQYSVVETKGSIGATMAQGDMIFAMMNGSQLLFIKDTSKASMSASEFKTAMSGVQLCYELATPQTIQLTPKNLETLVGQNDVFAPLEGQSFASAEYRDNMSVIYITDERVVGKWIDGKDIYQRTIDLGSSGVSVPANSSASTGLAKGNVQLPIWSTAISPSGQAFPYIGCSVGSTYIMMENKTGNATTVRYFTFQYTKS